MTTVSALALLAGGVAVAYYGFYKKRDDTVTTLGAIAVGIGIILLIAEFIHTY